MLAEQFSNSSMSIPKFHIVKEGENIATIAELYELPIDSLKKWNSLEETNDLVVGKELIIQLRK